VLTIGRKANLVGKVLSASTGTISQEQIATRPLLRPGEVLEDIPGLVISQHSGGGKANQYYLRGFQLDHGTNLDASIVGVPVNLGSHAHGQGYSDINYLIPELVSYVEFKKGLYFADQGDFAVAGGYSLYYRNTIEPTTEFTLGDFGYDRFFTAASPQVGAGHLLYGIELAHDNGSYLKPDEYHRFNGVLRYTQSKGPNDFAITGIAYNGSFNSTDQIPQRLVDAGALSRFGYVDPTDGGNTYRYALSTQFLHHDPDGGVTKLDVYGVNSFLSLISNFTYNLFDAQDYFNVTAIRSRAIPHTSPARPTRHRPMAAHRARRQRWWAAVARIAVAFRQAARPPRPAPRTTRHIAPPTIRRPPAQQCIPSRRRRSRFPAAISASRSISASTMASKEAAAS